MKRGTRGLLVVVLAGSLLAAACSSGSDGPTAAAASPSTTSSTSAATSTASVKLHAGMRELWEDHVQWTRLYIVSAVAGLPDADATLARLLQNQTDIGDAVAGFYGKAAGDKLTELLKGHIVTAGALLTAAKAGDKAATDKASADWYANADEIAAFLAGANRAWPASALRDMMRAHLDQTLAEATAQLTGDYATSVAEYDHIVSHILEMSDTLADGIVTQFPDRFTH